MYGTVRQRKVPSLTEELCNLTDQRKQAKLHFLFLFFYESDPNEWRPYELHKICM